jgi:hypothetical protein
MMESDLDRATELLFPQAGRRADDVKFFFSPGTTTAEGAARQIIACFDAMNDPSTVITSVDNGLTA